MNKESLIRVALVGSSGCGKTTISHSINKNQQKEKLSQSAQKIAINLNKFQMRTYKSQCLIYLWDSDGDHDYDEQRKSIIQGTDIILLVFDISQPNALAQIEDWTKYVNQIDPLPRKCLIANKTDLIPQVPIGEIQKFAHLNDMKLYLTTEKINAKPMFEEIIKQHIARRECLRLRAQRTRPNRNSVEGQSGVLSKIFIVPFTKAPTIAEQFQTKITQIKETYEQRLCAILTEHKEYQQKAIKSIKEEIQNLYLDIYGENIPYGSPTRSNVQETLRLMKNKMQQIKQSERAFQERAETKSQMFHSKQKKEEELQELITYYKSQLQAEKQAKGEIQEKVKQMKEKIQEMEKRVVQKTQFIQKLKEDNDSLNKKIRLLIEERKTIQTSLQISESYDIEKNKLLEQLKIKEEEEQFIESKLLRLLAKKKSPFIYSKIKFVIEEYSKKKIQGSQKIYELDQLNKARVHAYLEEHGNLLYIFQNKREDKVLIIFSPTMYIVGGKSNEGLVLSLDSGDLLSQFQPNNKNLWIYNPLNLIFGDFEFVFDPNRSVIKTRQKSNSFLKKVAIFQLSNDQNTKIKPQTTQCQMKNLFGSQDIPFRQAPPKVDVTRSFTRAKSMRESVPHNFELQILKVNFCEE